MTSKRWLWHGLVVCWLALACSATPVAAATLQFDAPVAAFCVDGEYPVIVTAGGNTLDGTLTMAAGAAAAVTGELAIGSEDLSADGKAEGEEGRSQCRPQGANAAGAKVSLKGIAAGTHLGRRDLGRSTARSSPPRWQRLTPT
jgi:hypothetical protein